MVTTHQYIGLPKKVCGHYHCHPAYSRLTINVKDLRSHSKQNMLFWRHYS